MMSDLYTELGRRMMKVRLVLRCLLLLQLLQSVCGQEPKVYGWLGKDVVLEFRMAAGNHITQVTWQRTENGQNVNFLINAIPDGIEPLNQFGREKVDYVGSGSTDGSIKIRNLSLADEGVYHCVYTVARMEAVKISFTLVVLVEPDLQLDPSPEPVLLRPPYETIATCVAELAKPPANISWLTEGLDYRSSENVLRYDNGTATTRSQLRMVPRSTIYGRNVTCVISQHNGTSDVNRKRHLSIQNVHYPPDSVEVLVKILGDGTIKFTCIESSNPPATNFTWRRRNDVGSVELGSGSDFSGKHLPDGLYICEVANLLGKSSGSLYFYTVPGKPCATKEYIEGFLPENCTHVNNPGSNLCLHACLWPWLILLIIAIGVFIVVRRQKLMPEALSRMVACHDCRKGSTEGEPDEVDEALHRTGV